MKADQARQEARAGAGVSEDEELRAREAALDPIEVLRPDGVERVAVTEPDPALEDPLRERPSHASFALGSERMKPREAR